MSIDGNLDNKSAIFSLKLLFGDTAERKYLIMHKQLNSFFLSNFDVSIQTSEALRGSAGLSIKSLFHTLAWWQHILRKLASIVSQEINTCGFSPK